MKKWKLTLFYIFTFSIGYFYIKNKAKKESLNVNEEIQVSTNIPFDINKIIEYLGNKENIESVNSTISYLKVKTKDISKVNVDLIKKLDVKGVMKSQNTISIIFGDYSKTLCEELKKAIK